VAELRLEIQDEDIRRNHEVMKIEAAQREEHIAQVLEQNIHREQ